VSGSSKCKFDGRGYIAVFLRVGRSALEAPFYVVNKEGR